MQARSLIIDYSCYGDRHTARDIVGDGYPKTMIEETTSTVSISSSLRTTGRNVGRRHDARKELCETLNLKGIIIGGRIPGYAEWAEKKSRSSISHGEQP